MNTVTTAQQLEVHDVTALNKAKEIIENSSCAKQVQQEVVNAVERNAVWRGEECLSLLAPGSTY